nr:MAG TPA: hypothetical protein [Caudoviricetes sp.]
MNFLLGCDTLSISQENGLKGSAIMKAPSRWPHVQRS